MPNIVSLLLLTQFPLLISGVWYIRTDKDKLSEEATTTRPTIELTDEKPWTHPDFNLTAYINQVIDAREDQKELESQEWWRHFGNCFLAFCGIVFVVGLILLMVFKKPKKNKQWFAFGLKKEVRLAIEKEAELDS